MLGVTWLLVVGSVTIMAANTDITWDEYKVKYKKNYSSPEEDEKHRQIFLAALKHVEDHNQKRLLGEVSYSIGINQFSDQERPQGVTHGPATERAEEQPPALGRLIVKSVGRSKVSKRPGNTRRRWFNRWFGANQS